MISLGNYDPRLDVAYLLMLIENEITKMEITIIEWGVDLRLYKEWLDAEVPATNQRG